MTGFTMLQLSDPSDGAGRGEREDRLFNIIWIAANESPNLGYLVHCTDKGCTVLKVNLIGSSLTRGPSSDGI